MKNSNSSDWQENEELSDEDPPLRPVRRTQRKAASTPSGHRSNTRRPSRVPNSTLTSPSGRNIAEDEENSRSSMPSRRRESLRSTSRSKRSRKQNSDSSNDAIDGERTRKKRSKAGTGAPPSYTQNDAENPSRGTSQAVAEPPSNGIHHGDEIDAYKNAVREAVEKIALQLPPGFTLTVDEHTTVPQLTLSESIMIPNAEIQSWINILKASECMRHALLHRLPDILSDYLDGNALSGRRTRHEIRCGLLHLRHRLINDWGEIERLYSDLIDGNLDRCNEWGLWVPQTICLMAGIPERVHQGEAMDDEDPRLYGWEERLARHDEQLALATMLLMHNLTFIANSDHQLQALRIALPLIIGAFDSIARIVQSEPTRRLENQVSEWVSGWGNGFLSQAERDWEVWNLELDPVEH